MPIPMRSPFTAGWGRMMSVTRRPARCLEGCCRNWRSTFSLPTDPPAVALKSSLKQRRGSRYAQGSEKHRAVDEAQGESAGLLAFQFRLGAERVDAGGDADIGV